MPSSGISVLKFVGTVSLGLLTGVSYSVSAVGLPTINSLPSATSASLALTNLTSHARLPVLVLTTLASAPLLLAFAFSPRSARHPYLVYSALLAGLSAAAPVLFPPQSASAAAASRHCKKQQQQAARAGSRAMEASYEVLGDAQSEAPSEEDNDDVNGEEVRAEVDSSVTGYVVRTGVAALGFAMAVVGIWGDGSHQAVVYLS